MNIQDHPEYQNRITDPAQLVPGRMYQTFFDDRESDKWKFKRFLNTSKEAANTDYYGSEGNKKVDWLIDLDWRIYGTGRPPAFTVPLPHKSRRRITPPIRIEWEKVLLPDGTKGRKIVAVSGMRVRDLPLEYVSSVPKVWLSVCGKRLLGLTSKNLDRDLFVDRVYPEAYYQDFLKFTNECGERLTKILRKQRREAREWRGSGVDEI